MQCNVNRLLNASYCVKQCFLLQLISSGHSERQTNFSSSMMRIFQRGLLSQRYIFWHIGNHTFISELEIKILYLISGAMVSLCLSSRDKEAPRLTDSGFQFLVCNTLIMSILHYIVINYNFICVFTADGYKCTTLVYYQRIYLKF